jgi:hypothetical protein
LIRLRSIAILITGLLLLALPALAAAADVSANGTMSGLAVPQPAEPGVAECTPGTATDPEDFVCDFNTTGTFDLEEVGTGAYTGELRLDWSIYTGAEPCAEATGTLMLTTVDGTLQLVVQDTSRVCETGDPEVHDASFDVTVTSGTGAFAGAAGTLTATGTMTPSAGSGEYDTELDVTGTITVPDPTPPPSISPAPVPSDDAAPTASAPAASVPAGSASAVPTGLLPNTASGSSGPLTGLFLILAVTLVASLGVGAIVRRSA